MRIDTVQRTKLQSIYIAMKTIYIFSTINFSLQYYTFILFTTIKEILQKKQNKNKQIVSENNTEATNPYCIQNVSHMNYNNIDKSITISIIQI